MNGIHNFIVGRRGSGASRRLGIGVVGLVALSTAVAATQRSVPQTPPIFSGAPLDSQRAARIARASGMELIGVRRCVDNSPGCALLALRGPDGTAVVYQLSATPCKRADNGCLGGFTVTDRWGGGRRGERQLDARAKISGAPGKDGAPPDPQSDAQADATNEIIEALAEGKYDGNYEGFWSDLESIQTWDQPTWLEPDPAPPIQDKIRATGAFGKANPAALVSGRYKNNATGRTECRSWTGFTSLTASLQNIGNWISNAPLDGCDSEVAIFSEDGAADLVRPERRWTNGADELIYSAGSRIKVPTSVWVIYGRRGFATEKTRLEAEFDRANDILTRSRCGIELGDVSYYDRTTVLPDPEVDLGCPSIESTLKKVGFHENKMNVYVVKALVADERAGVACTAESENVIVLDAGRGDIALAHEFGHWFDLWHTTNMPLVNDQNIMSDGANRTMLTAGQCYRANFSTKSYINMRGLRKGETKRCSHLQDADNQCPGVKNEF